MKKFDISQAVLGEIKKKKIEPRARWVFILRNATLWLLSLVALVTSSLIFSVIIYMIKGSGWEMYRFVNPSVVKFTLMTLPYFWIVFLFVTIVVIIYNYKLTKHGYRHKIAVTVLSSVVISVLMGFVFYSFGASKLVDDFTSKRMQQHLKIINPNLGVWNDPAKGVMMGMVTDIKEDNQLEVLDVEGKNWLVQSSSDVFADQDIKVGSRIRLIGEQQGDGTFKTEIMFEFGPGKEGIRPPERVKKCMMSPECSRRVIRAMPHRHECINNPEKCQFIANKNIKAFEEKEREVGLACKKHEDCKTPFEYMVKSNCPHTSKCLKDKCAVVCEMPFNSQGEEESGVGQCENDSDCSERCKKYWPESKEPCLCVDGGCLIVVDDGK